MYAPYPENMMESIKKGRGYKSRAYGNRAETSDR